MKKENKDKISEYIIEFIVGFVFIVALGIVYYLEEEYEVTNILWILNIILLVTSPLYYFLHDFREKIKTKRIEKNVIIENIDFEYYRDIIKEYSPATLSLILDGLEIEKDLAASVIYLINKGYLQLQEDNKIIRTNKNCYDLSQDLQLLCNSDVNHLLACTRFFTKSDNEKMQSHNSAETREKWFKMVERQAIQKGLVTQREDKHWITLTILFIFGVIESMFCFMTESFGLLFFSNITVFLLMLLRVWAFDENKFVKTQKGYELYKKIVGLKNYINDYSTLSDNELKEITIWEDYLIYSIIFNNTSKLNKEAMDYYKRICNIRDEEKSKPKIKKSIKIYSILSIIIPLVSIIMYINDNLLFLTGIALAILGFCLTFKGKEYNKTLTNFGYIINTILIAIIIFVQISMWAYNWL